MTWNIKARHGLARKGKERNFEELKCMESHGKERKDVAWKGMELKGMA
jgi:hypothetical protein